MNEQMLEDSIEELRAGLDRHEKAINELMGQIKQQCYEIDDEIDETKELISLIKWSAKIGGETGEAPVTRL